MSDVSLLRQHGLLMRLVSIDQHTSNLNAERFFDRQKHIIFQTTLSLYGRIQMVALPYRGARI